METRSDAKKILPILLELAAALAVGGALFFAVNTLAGDGTLSFGTVADYFDRASVGLIKPAPGDWSDLRFVEFSSSKWNKFFMPPKLDPAVLDRSQNAFQFDVPEFIKRMEADDFLEAKQLFYMTKEYDPFSQTHKRPYYYMYSWGSLFHPPIKKLTLSPEKYSRDFAPQGEDKLNEVFFEPSFQQELDMLSDTQLTRGNELKLLPDQMAFEEKLRLIRSAKKTLLVASLVFVCDPSTMELVNAMAEAKKRGVDVKVIAETLTSVAESWVGPHPNCAETMRKKGVDVLLISDVFNPANPYGVMHHKLWIRDMEEAIIGGQNVLDAENKSTGFNFKNRDTDLLVRKGPVVADVSREYIQLWDTKRNPDKNGMLHHLVTEVNAKIRQEYAQKLRGPKNYGDWLADPKTRMDGLCRVAVQAPGADTHSVAALLYGYIHASKSSLFFNSPTAEYEDLEKGKLKRSWLSMITDEIIKKSDRENILVHLVSNGFEGGNGELTIQARELYQKAQASGHSLIASFFRQIQFMTAKSSAKSNHEGLRKFGAHRNIKPWTYMGYNHSKTYIFDRTAVAAGSFNLDLYSTERSYETQIFCLDRKLLKEAEDLFLLDLVNSVPVTELNSH